jgi:hypothetical protein
MLTQEIINWAKHSKQDSILLKLDFSKPFDKIYQDFLFLVMKRLIGLKVH